MYVMYIYIYIYMSHDMPIKVTAVSTVCVSHPRPEIVAMLYRGYTLHLCATTSRSIRDAMSSRCKCPPRCRDVYPEYIF